MPKDSVQLSPYDVSLIQTALMFFQTRANTSKYQHDTAQAIIVKLRMDLGAATEYTLCGTAH